MLDSRLFVVEMNKSVFVGFVIMLFLLVSSFVDATAITPYYSYSSGTSQYYSVVFDNELEAAVGAVIDIQNTASEPLTKVTFEIPGRNIRLINALQEVNTSSHSYYSYRYEAKYYSLNKSVEQLSNSAKYTVNLDVPINPGGQGTITIYYKAQGMAERSLGVNKFAFKTVKIPFDVNTVRVSLNVQPDMQIKGFKSTVINLPNLAVAESFSAKGIASKPLAEFSSNVRYQNSGFVKSAFALDPWEGFVVAGDYSKSWFALYWQKVLLWSLVGVSAIIAFIVAVRLFFKKLQSGKSAIANSVLVSLGNGVVSLILLSVLAYFLRSDMLFLTLMLITVVLSVFLPTVYIGAKHGPSFAVLTFLLSLLLVSVAVVVSVFILAATTTPIYYYSVPSILAVQEIV
jgi:hypothetical protein